MIELVDLEIDGQLGASCSRIGWGSMVTVNGGRVRDERRRDP
jgi:hypothetical protein